MGRKRKEEGEKEQDMMDEEKRRARVRRTGCRIWETL